MLTESEYSFLPGDALRVFDENRPHSLMIVSFPIPRPDGSFGYFVREIPATSATAHVADQSDQEFIVKFLEERRPDRYYSALVSIEL